MVRDRPIAALSLMALAWLALPGASDLARAQAPKTGAATPAKPAPPAAPVGPDPASTSASYGDWVLRCRRLGEADKARRLCEVAQTIQVQGQQGPIAQIAFGKVAAGEPLKLTVALPPNVSLPGAVTVGLGAADKAPVELGWRRCLPGACIADAVPTADAVKAFRSAAEPGRVAFKDASGREIAFPLSFRGLAQALDALVKN